MKKCAVCGQPITRKNNGFSELLSNVERKKALGLKPEQTICMECKYLAMSVEIFSPFYN